MATSYGNTKIDRGNTRLDSRGDLVSLRPETAIIIQDEENPIPDKYEGDINFNKTVYSLKEFKDKVDLGFNELLSNRPTVNIQQFFDLYNEIFFDIPKEGENSHTTIVQTSLDYLDNYVNPLQAVIDARDLEIQSLNEQLLTIQGELADIQIAVQEDEAADAAEAAAEAAAQAEYEGRYGNDYVNDPLIKYNDLITNLEGDFLNAVNDFNIGGNNLNVMRNKFEDAKDEGGGNTRNWSVWRQDMINTTGNNDRRDAGLYVIDQTKSNIAAGVGAVNGQGPQL